jgi:tRNA threonylcarbamoyladenosine biosynthesis protein TsaE
MTRLYTIEEIDEIAVQVLQHFPATRCFAFEAEMGCGKTTMIKSLCKALGVKDNVHSPTFSIINEYVVQSSNKKVYHMDWYRLKNDQDAIEAGVQDILEQKESYCFIEWPEIAQNLLPKYCQFLKISFESAAARKIVSVPL